MVGLSTRLGVAWGPTTLLLSGRFNIPGTCSTVSQTSKGSSYTCMQGHLIREKKESYPMLVAEDAGSSSPVFTDRVTMTCGK